MAAVARAAVAATAMAAAATAAARGRGKRVDDAFRDARLKLVAASARAAAIAWAIAPLQERESTRVRATVAEVAEVAEVRPT